MEGGAPERRADRRLVQDAVVEQIRACDAQWALRSVDDHDIRMKVTDSVIGSMARMSRFEVDDEDRSYIKWRVRKMVKEYLDSYDYLNQSDSERPRSCSPSRLDAQGRSRSRSRSCSPRGRHRELSGSPTPKRESEPTRFQRSDRVVCNVGAAAGWVPGNVQSVNEKDPEDRANTLPYVVKLDPPDGRLISVQNDDSSAVRAEVCFGLRAGGLIFTLFCLPMHSAKTKRFGVGGRVACAVEDDTGDHSLWAAGTVLDVDYSVEEIATDLLAGGDWKGNAGRVLNQAREKQAAVPYRVQLDTGGEVLVHQDEHWLVRDSLLQAEGPRQAADGTHCVERIEKSKRGDEWEVVDHATCHVRRLCPPPASAPAISSTSVAAPAPAPVPAPACASASAADLFRCGQVRLFGMNSGPIRYSAKK